MGGHLLQGMNLLNLERGDGVGTAAVTLVEPIAYFTRVCDH
jgi:hypothetical protein